MTRVDVAPDLLRWAVERAGWSDETVDQRAPRLEAWLTGTRPTLKQLEKFAHDTHTPLGLLFLREPPDEQIPIPDLRTMGNARLRRPSADLLDTIYQCQSRQDWYQDYTVEHGYAELEFVGSASVETPPELVADEVRGRLEFGLGERGVFASWEDARRRLIDRIEAIGVLVMVNGVVGSNTHRRLRPEEFRGFALADRHAPLIFVNGADTKAAQIFTLVHELGHVWLGESALSDAAMNSRNGHRAELWCNKVAAEVLVPIAALRRDYRGEPIVEEFERLARRYRVSTLVVVKRLYDAGFLQWDHFDRLYADEQARVVEIIAARGQAPGGNYYYTQPLRLSRQFASAVIASTFEGGTSFREAYRLLGTKKHDTFINLAAELGMS
ncbi:Domain of uncharacterised function (DUF955) [Nocardia otitidiscaviarum]|uniref:Domain of uncharacterized function (DUF955) n=1 Tax=Nocardia otitidiscaviarum TaxID=1823 RepID=A0A378YFC8_9NOCA|nr:ImmA/IrrE family metallo-endopeptidase [Nocardia otitidiscaviarum]SUA75935.1 Domain of uncharacterised function (DUF955) [Nocardia otitidiscaviarum]